jgi:hypothetical protein
MAKKLTGRLNLSKIPKELIVTDKYGDKVVWVDVLERLAQGRYGETHSISVYDKTNRKSIYIAELTPQEFGKSADPAPKPEPKPTPAPTADDGDLPF